jgi:hypothetical protein
MIGLDHMTPDISTNSARGPETTGKQPARTGQFGPESRPPHSAAERPFARVHNRYMRSSGLPNVQPGDRAADQHPLDLRRALEDREDPGGRGSFRRSAACGGLWYQHGSSTGCWRVAAVRTRAEKAPLAYSAQVHARYICTLTCQYSSCRRDVALRRHDRGRGARTGHTRAGCASAVFPGRLSSARHGGAMGRTGRDTPGPADTAIMVLPVRAAYGGCQTHFRNSPRLCLGTLIPAAQISRG